MKRLIAAAVALVAVAMLAVPCLAADDADADGGLVEVNNTVYGLSGSRIIMPGMTVALYSGTVTWLMICTGNVVLSVDGSDTTYAVSGAAQITDIYDTGTHTVVFTLPNGAVCSFGVIIQSSTPAPTPTPTPTTPPDVEWSWSQLSEHDQQLVEAVIAACLLPGFLIVPFWMARKSESWEDVI